MSATGAQNATEKASVPNSRTVDSRSTNLARSVVKYDGTVIWRDTRIDDFGINALLEFFPNGRITGRYMPMQLKGTSRTIQPLKTSECVSCSIKTTTYKYAQQDALPILLLYISLEDHLLYHGIIQELIKSQQDFKKPKEDAASVTLHTPVTQVMCTEATDFGSVLWNLYRTSWNLVG